jgi:hypothetical protein
MNGKTNLFPRIAAIFGNGCLEALSGRSDAVHLVSALLSFPEWPLLVPLRRKLPRCLDE